MYRPSSFSQLPEVVKNLLIINGLFFLATISLQGSNTGIDLVRWFGLHQFQSPDFMPHQLITHFFMHSNFTHLLSNMFALWMFGRILENVWGAKRFLIYYIITGLGAAMIYILFVQYQIYGIANEFPDFLEAAKDGKVSGAMTREGFIPYIESSNLFQLVNTPMVGASGAVFGLLLAFGMLFPNTRLHLFASLLIIMSFEIFFSIPLPIFNIFIFLFILSRINPNLKNYIWYTIPIQAKYFVVVYGLIELYLGFINNPNDNIAHFAHLGGMLFGFILLKYWQKNNTQFY